MLLEDSLKCSLGLRVNHFLESNQHLLTFNNSWDAQLFVYKHESSYIFFNKSYSTHLIHISFHVIFVCWVPPSRSAGWFFSNVGGIPGCRHIFVLSVLLGLWALGLDSRLPRQQAGGGAGRAPSSSCWVLQPLPKACPIPGVQLFTVLPTSP